MLIGLRRYRNSTRWKQFFLNHNERDHNILQTSNENPSPLSPGLCFSINSDSNDSSDIESMNNNLETGLGTCAKPTLKANVPIGSPELESFLNELEEKMNSRIEDYFYNEKLLENFHDEENSIRSKSTMKSKNQNQNRNKPNAWKI